MSILLVSMSLFSCNSTSQKQETDSQQSLYSMLPEDSAGIIAKECIIKSGGLEKWNNLKAISYTKFIQQYDSLGNLAKEITEYHVYLLQPRWKVKMRWKDNNTDYILLNDGDTARKYVNGILDTSKRAYRQALLKTGGSFYVFGMPYKLADSDSKLTYEGVQKILGMKVYCIRANYSKGDSLAALYPWWYYFDINTKAIVASAINENDGTFDLTEYLSFDTVNGMKLQSKRMISLADKDKNMMYKGNIVTNSDFKTYDSLPDSVFYPPGANKKLSYKSAIQKNPL